MTIVLLIGGIDLSVGSVACFSSLIAALLASIYPFMKRYTHLPQLVLGLAFSWGIPMAFAAQRNELPASLWLLFLGNLWWIVAYDTKYAMVDRDDDILAGVKSTATIRDRLK